MKLLAILLATFITVLTIQPTVELLNSSTEKEMCYGDNCCEADDDCSQSSNTEKQDPNGCCPGGICNPFEACNCCCGGIVGKPFISSITSFIKINYSTLNQNNLVFGFHSKCFQPPEAV